MSIDTNINVYNTIEDLQNWAINTIANPPTNMGWRVTACCMAFPSTIMGLMYSTSGWGDIGNAIGAITGNLYIGTIITGNPIYVMPSMIFTGSVIALNAYDSFKYKYSYKKSVQ